MSGRNESSEPAETTGVPPVPSAAPPSFGHSGATPPSVQEDDDGGAEARWERPGDPMEFQDFGPAPGATRPQPLPPTPPVAAEPMPPRPTLPRPGPMGVPPFGPKSPWWAAEPSESTPPAASTAADPEPFTQAASTAADPESFAPVADPEPFTPATGPEPFTPAAEPEPFNPATSTAADPEPFSPAASTVADPETFAPVGERGPFSPVASTATDPDPAAEPVSPPFAAAYPAAATEPVTPEPAPVGAVGDLEPGTGDGSVPGTLVAGIGVASVDTRRAVPAAPVPEKEGSDFSNTDPDGFPAPEHLMNGGVPAPDVTRPEGFDLPVDEAPGWIPTPEQQSGDEPAFTASGSPFETTPDVGVPPVVTVPDGTDPWRPEQESPLTPDAILPPGVTPDDPGELSASFTPPAAAEGSESVDEPPAEPAEFHQDEPPEMPEGFGLPGFDHIAPRKLPVDQEEPPADVPVFGEFGTPLPADPNGFDDSFVPAQPIDRDEFRQSFGSPPPPPPDRNEFGQSFSSPPPPVDRDEFSEPPFMSQGTMPWPPASSGGTGPMPFAPPPESPPEYHGQGALVPVKPPPPPPRQSNRRLLVGGGVAAAVLVTAVAAVGVTTMSGSSDGKKKTAAAPTATRQANEPPATASPAPSAAPTAKPPSAKAVIDSEKTDKRPLTLSEVFPSSKIQLGDRAFLQDRTSVNHQCGLAARGAMIRALESGGCRSIVRATYVSTRNGLAVTTGVVAMPTRAAALKTRAAGDPSEYEWFRGMPGKRSTKIDKAGGFAASTVRGRYVVYSYATYANGTLPKPGDQTLKTVSQQFIGFAVRPLDARAT